MSLEIGNPQRSLEPFGSWSYHERHVYEGEYEEEASRLRLLSTSVALPSSPLDQPDGRRVISGAAAGSVSSRPVAPSARLAMDSWDASPTTPTTSCSSPGSDTTFDILSESTPSLEPSIVNINPAINSGPLSKPSSLSNQGFCCGASGPSELDEFSPFVDSSCRPPKRRRPLHDVDGLNTAHLSSKKRRLRLHLITSRLSQPFSLPATHILNRESDEGTPVLSRFVKFAAMGAKRAGHQTALVRKAAILNRVRLNVRQAAVNRGHERIWKMAGMGVMEHGIQLVTASTGAMFPGRSGEQVPGPIVPRAWRPHTTALSVSQSAAFVSTQESSMEPLGQNLRPPPAPRLPLVDGATMQPSTPPVTSIMTPMPGGDDDSSFPAPDLDNRYADMSDDDMDDVYADFGVLFGGGGSADSPERVEEDDHFYEEYLDEVDGITWAS